MNTFEAQKPRLSPGDVASLLIANEKANQYWQSHPDLSSRRKAAHMRLFRETNMKLYAELYKKGS